MILQSSPVASVDEDKAAIAAAVERVVRSGWYVLGPEVEAFERAFADYIGTAHAVGVGNGTDAVSLALEAVGVGPGHRVALPAHTAVATAAAVMSIGAEPVWVDIDPATCVITAETLAAALDAAPGPVKAAVAVHLYGGVADPVAIGALCRARGLKFVEDCAQAHGARWNGRRVGSFGDAAAFSFYPTKNLGALGDGGIVATSDARAAERVRLLRQYGWRERYVSDEVGRNSRLDPIQAAILGVFLPRLDARNAQRRAIAAIYDAALAGIPGLALPCTAPEAEPVFHQYVIQTAARDGLAAFLRDNGIGTAIHYPVPVHRQPAYARFPAALPHTEAAARRILSLPIYPQLPPEAAKRVAERVRAYLCRTV